MHLILLSGGSGKRLWPLSNDIRAKQFLKILQAPDGTMESMVQRVYRQLKSIDGWSSITVAAGAAQRDQLVMQLGEDVNIIIEPERRDTFPAIALACSYLYDHLGVREDEDIVVLPVDPFVEEEYFLTIKKVPEILTTMKNGLVLLGATPTFPSEKYGYIVPQSPDRISLVKYFKEKPNRTLAQDLISQGALWNCGIFGLKLKYILNILREKYEITNLSYKEMLKIFTLLKKTSFDYEVVENAEQIKVITYNGKWKDLGTWETLTEEMAETRMGYTVADERCENTHLINEWDIPLIGMGLKDIVVVASRDGFLAAEKGETYRLKEFISDLKARPMYEDRRWGSYKVLDHITYEDKTESLTKKLHLLRGKQISYQYHNHRKELWTIISGKGMMYLDGRKYPVAAGDVIQIREGQKHGIYAESELEIIEVQIGNPLIEEDIIRLDMDWSV